MDQLAAMRAFVKVVDLAGFSAAARSLDLSTAMISKHIASLERHLGVPLLARTTRRVVPTEAGQRFHVHCLDILRAVEEAEQEVGTQALEAVGCLRITAPVELGQRHLAPLLPLLLERYPGLSIYLDLSNRVVDLVEEGFDVAIRVAPTLDTSLRGRLVTSSRLMLVAAPSYLQRHGCPAEPGDLSRHALLTFSLGSGRQWVLRQGELAVAVELRPRLIATSSDAVRQAACAAAGIAMLPTFLVHDELASGALQPVLADWHIATLKIFALHPNRRTMPARLRVFFDALIQRFGHDPEADGFAGGK
jgi:DNA-binding transcriptional LysR family regulator